MPGFSAVNTRTSFLSLADKGFDGLPLDTVTFLDDVDEFDLDRNRVVEKTAQVGQQFFELRVIIPASFDDFDDDDFDQKPKKSAVKKSTPKKEEEISSGELGAFFVGID